MRYQDNPQMQKDFQRKRYKDNHEIKTDYQKMTYQQNAETDKKASKTEISRKRKKIRGKVGSFLQQVKQDLHYICTIYCRSLYQRSVRLCTHEKYNIITPEIYHPVKPFDEKLYICETCHKYLNKSEIPCQVVGSRC